jgi:thermitase
MAVLRPRLVIAGVSALAIAILAAAPTASAAGSLALGQPTLHSESVASDGLVTSRVPDAARVASNEALATFAPQAKAHLEALMRAHPGVTLVGSLVHLPVDLLRVAPADRKDVIAWLTAQAGVVSVQANAIERADSVVCQPGTGCEIPDDPGLPYQWYLYNAPGNPPPPGAGPLSSGVDVDAPSAWSHTLGSTAVRIAIVDSGVDAGHPDLAGKVVAAANFTASNTTADLSGHGTHVAGIAAADFDNLTGIAGVAPNARLMDVKVLAVGANGQTTGDCADVADGIVWATDHGANVINMSLGSSSPCQAMALAINYAFAHGALPVAAAGNDGSTTRSYPAAYDHVLSVAATGPSDQIAGFSNRDAAWVDVAAPGIGIVSTLPTYANATGAVGYGYLNGTSMAAPIVSGIAALIWSQMPPGQANRDVEARIFASSEAIAGTGTDWRYGRVDACRAVTANNGPCSGLPTAPTPAPAPAPAPPPSQVAQPAPIGPPAPLVALPGTYAGSLGRLGGPLRLEVADGGSALIRIQAKVLLRCQAGQPRRVQIRGLSTTKFAKIKPDGKFSFTLRVKNRVAGPLQVQAKGTFDVAGRRARGTLRVTGSSRPSGRCDSTQINWTTSVAAAAA